MKKYSTTNVYAGVIYNGFGVSTDEDAPKLCTFTYGGVKYCGLKWTGAASLDNIKTLIYDISSTGLPFYVKYFNSQSGEVFNAEIKNSIVELGSDIILYNTSTPCGLFTSANKGLEIKAKDNAWAFTRYNTNGRIVDTGLSGTTAGLAGQTGNYEIRPGANNNEGVFVRYSGSSYGKFAVVNRSGSECSIGYYNNVNPTGDKPVWTVGAGIRNQWSFDWWYSDAGIKMTMDSDGKLFVNRKSGDAPSISLAIGDNDSGLHQIEDGRIRCYSNNKDVGNWGYTDARFHNVTFREASNNDYNGLGLMVNGNGTANTVKPGIGFHQPGVYAGSLRLDGAGGWTFAVQGGSTGGTVSAGSFYANGGWLYSNVNGCEIRIGSQNTSYVHITNNANRPYYIDNTINISGTISPYSDNTYDLGRSASKWNYIWGNHFMGNSASATFILPNYVGGQQANPQTYFNNSMGVKVAMTGVNPDSYWGDTLWINGYGGTDVPDMCALHFSRGGAPLIYISSQKYHATSYGTMYHIWTGYNSNHSSAAWTCSTLNANGRISTTSDIYSAGWVRAGGSNGFYCESYGGGIHMTDSTWVRVYNGKQFYVGSTSSDAIHTAGGINASGRIYAGGHLSTNGGLAVSGIYGGSGASGFNVYAVFQGRSDHGGIEVRASDNTFGIGVHSNDHMYWWWGTSTSTNSSSGKSYIMDYGGGNWSFTGNHYVSGYSTWGSDSRYKTYLGEVTLQLDQIADSPTIYYRWNSKKRDRDGLLHVGGYAQYTEQILPELTHETSDFKTMDYAVCAYVYAVHAARFLRNHLLSDYEWKSDTELRMDALEKENIKLRNRIEQLERRAA
ncbi:shufflon system plasmid conjugative transfer pilus tip adhesin PilV [Bacteroides fragilis]